MKTLRECDCQGQTVRWWNWDSNPRCLPSFCTLSQVSHCRHLIITVGPGLPCEGKGCASLLLSSLSPAQCLAQSRASRNSCPVNNFQLFFKSLLVRSNVHGRLLKVAWPTFNPTLKAVVGKFSAKGQMIGISALRVVRSVSQLLSSAAVAGSSHTQYASEGA